jgi:hypothetical protein
MPLHASPARPAHATDSATLADILERVLDKGVVIAGDIKVKLVDIELLTIQVRLVVCSVDKAVEMGMDWWRREPDLVGFTETQALPGAAPVPGEQALRAATPQALHPEPPER